MWWTAALPAAKNILEREVSHLLVSSTPEGLFTNDDYFHLCTALNFSCTVLYHTHLPVLVVQACASIPQYLCDTKTNMSTSFTGHKLYNYELCFLEGDKICVLLLFPVNLIWMKINIQFNFNLKNKFVISGLVCLVLAGGQKYEQPVLYRKPESLINATEYFHSLSVW